VPTPRPARPERVFITGASSGIGAALAGVYRARGAQLGLVARRAIDPVTPGTPGIAIPPIGPHAPDGSDQRDTAQILTWQADVTDPAALRAAALEFITKFGVPDVVIANAGISIGTLTEHADDRAPFARIFATNVQGMFDTFQPFIGPMRAACAADPGLRPRLVGVASVAGVRGLPGSEAYSASKAAAISYCESLRVELRGTGIRVVTLMPGFIATPMTARNPYPMPFLMPAEDFARRAVAAIDAGVSQRVIPWQMAIVARLLRLMPNWLYDRAFANAGRKPREGDAQ